MLHLSNKTVKDNIYKKIWNQIIKTFNTSLATELVTTTSYFKKTDL